MEERTTLGLYGSAQFPTRIRPSAPRASAVRQMVPTLPGSWTPSSTRYRFPASVSGGLVSGRRAKNRAPWGVFMGEMVSITSLGTRTARTSEGRAGSSTPSDTTTVVRGARHFRASSNSFLPSPRYSPASRRSRPLPEASFRIWVSSGFFRLVIHSIGSLLLSIFQGCAERHTNGKNFHRYAMYASVQGLHCGGHSSGFSIRFYPGLTR